MSTRPFSSASSFSFTTSPGTNTARPWTAQSTRPGTARPVTSASTVRHDGTYVIAVLEGRGIAREVGLAAFDKETGKCMLVQITDCQTYVKTLHQMHLHTPALVLVPDTFLSAKDASLLTSGSRAANTSLLVELIRDEFPGAHIEPIGRKYWNETAGMEFIQQLCVQDEERAGLILAVVNKYYALSAVSALYKHAQMKLNMRFAPGSLRIRYIPVEGTMLIDPESAKNLELVGNMSSRKSLHSLYGIMKHTFTAMGSRLLRVTILSPLTTQVPVEARLDVVDEFVQSEDLFSDVRAALKALKDLDFDKLIASLVATETKATSTANEASSRVQQMLNLRSAVRSLPALRRAVGTGQSQLLRVACNMLSDERLAAIEELIGSSLNEDGVAAKHGIIAVNSRVYAVKANHNRLLDVARETYKENVGDIHTLCNALGEAHNLPLSLTYLDSGFVLSLKKTDLDGGELPRGFINVCVKKGKLQFSIMELKKMNARMKDALDETLILSNKIIQDLVADILIDIDALYKSSEAVALVDMLWSFSHATIMRNYIRPEFTGTLAIKAGRHPILETIQTRGTLVPNDVYIDDASSFQLIQGPNMSGKSTYLRQLALLTIMAMCGCFVPADYASFRLHDSLLTRLSNDDDIEKNLSTFASEMATSAMILGLATPMSLILVDELGRGTSPREGVGISHAIAEGLIEQNAFVLFATHFSELTSTLSRQPTVVNLYLSVQKNRRSSASIGMIFNYKIIDGVQTDIKHYGLDLAWLADLPEDVLKEGHRVATTLAAANEQTKAKSKSEQIAIRRKALLKLRTQLTQAYEHSALPNQDLIAYVARFQKDITRAFLYADSDS